MKHLGIFNEEYRNFLLIGIGGGGDIVGTIPLYLALTRSNLTAIISGIPWERFVVDPKPGPISLDELRGSVVRRSNYSVIIGPVYAARGNGVVIPQASIVSRILKTNVILFDASGGFRSLYEGVKEVVHDYSIDVVVGVDVGGDVLAIGVEEELWSPLLDHLALAVLYELEKNLGVETYIAVWGPGCDGELSLATLKEYIARLALNGYFVGGLALTREDVEVLEEILNHVVTEASRCPVKVFYGHRGMEPIRLGTRVIEYDLTALLLLLFKTQGVYMNSVLARHLVGTSSIYEANEVLHKYGVYSELDLEIDIASGKLSEYLDPVVLRKVRRHTSILK